VNFKSSNNEVVYRVIIGRAYYSAFLCAREEARLDPKVSDGHKKVIDHFERINVTISNQLKDLKELRHGADYYLSPAIVKRDAGNALRLSKKILTSLNYLS
jgi:uncharacterized protein (UPF0332 family)